MVSGISEGVEGEVSGISEGVGGGGGVRDMWGGVLGISEVAGGGIRDKWGGGVRDK